MAVTDSRVRNGKLTLTAGADTVEAACQAKNVRIDADIDGGDDRIEVLCGDVMTGSASPRDTLHIESIQDFTDPAGVQAFLWRNRGQVADFTWQPTADTNEVWSGKVTVVAPSVGGDVNTQLDYSLDLPIVSHTKLFTGFGDGQIHSGIVVITGVTAPTGGAKVWTFTPANATLPASLALLQGHTVVGNSGTSKPSRDFTAGEYILLGDGSKAHFATAGGWAAGEGS